MFIFVDESGSFVHSAETNAWCTVAAYVTPEHRRRDLEHLITQIRALNNGQEAKLKHLTEEQYLMFLGALRKLDGIVFAVAVDAGWQRPDAILEHRARQVEKILQHQDKMIYEQGRQAVADLAALLGSIPPQLYVQLIAQVRLFNQVIEHSTLYYAQRHPPALANFRWRIDRKAKVETRYEKAFCRLLSPLIQTQTLADPWIMLEGADYSYFEKFSFPEGQEPTHLKDEYGIEIENPGDLGRIIRDDFRFVDSDASAGVQVADLISAGIFRVLRGRFRRSDDIAKALGAIFTSPWKHDHCIRFVTMDSAGDVERHVARSVALMDRHSRPIIAPRR